MAVSDFVECKRCREDESTTAKNAGAQHPPAVETDGIERALSMRHAWGSGEMHRHHEELRLRRQQTGAQLTLKHERVGIEQD